MKNRIFIISILAISCMTTSVFAKINANTDAQSNSISVSGSAANYETQIVLIKPGFNVSDAENAAASANKGELGNVIEFFGQVTAKDDSIDANIPMRADAEKGKYLLVIGKDTSSVYFATLSERLGTMVPNAKNALSNGTFGQFAEGDGKYFCNSELYEALSASGNAAKYASAMLNEYKNADNSEFMSKLSAAMNMGIIMEALNESKITDFETIKSMTDSTGMTVPIDKADLIKPDKLKNVISDVSGKNFASEQEYKKCLSESIFMNVFYNAANMSNTEKKAFFETYANQAGLNLASYAKLTDNKKAEVLARLSAENNTSLPSLQSAMDELCKGMAVKTEVGGGGGSSSSSSEGIKVTYNNVQNENIASDNVYGLKDLAECQWAKPAVECLLSRKMISGYEDNTFRPFKNISRAEFVSIIARKYLTVKDYEQSFSDVKADNWCFRYVESAYNSGIISGAGENIFAPNENITRQDISVILCKLAEYLGCELSADINAFADDSEISDYARNAVYCLRNAGIITGDENGKFNPRATATRAEAAQMIYKFMGFLE